MKYRKYLFTYSVDNPHSSAFSFNFDRYRLQFRYWNGVGPHSQKPTFTSLLLGGSWTDDTHPSTKLSVIRQSDTSDFLHQLSLTRPSPDFCWRCAVISFMPTADIPRNVPCFRLPNSCMQLTRREFRVCNSGSGNAARQCSFWQTLCRSKLGKSIFGLFKIYKCICSGYFTVDQCSFWLFFVKGK
jgi:hypothetical protein